MLIAFLILEMMNFIGVIINAFIQNDVLDNVIN